MPSQKRKFGDLGESAAEQYLINHGYKIIEKNYQKPWGEIDLIALKNELLVFFEVKTRDKRNVEHYPPESAVNRNKIRKLKRICEYYLIEGKYPYSQVWQIDILGITIEKDSQQAEVNHLENAVWEKQY